MSPFVFIGSDPPPGRSFDWVAHPAARTELDGDAAIPDIGVVKQLLDESVPVVDAMTAEPQAALLRDELFQLVLTVARVEALRRDLDGVRGVTVVSTRHLTRPSRPSRIARGLAGFLDADLELVGQWRPSRFPAGLVGSARALRWSRASRTTTAGRVVLAIGGPSERRALEPIAARITDAVMVDFGNDRDPSLPGFGGWLSIFDAIAPLGARSFTADAIGAWDGTDWWGRKWLPWVRDSLAVTGRITLREAVLYRRAAARALESARALVTAKVRHARARAIVAAARDLGAPTVATQHGMYVDGNEWTDLRVDAFGVSGDSFRRTLELRSFAGRVETVGAPFYEVPPVTWDCAIALQPPEGVVVTTPGDYEAHATAAYRAARAALGSDAMIGFRLHPREDEQRLRRIVGDGVPMGRGAAAGGRRWVTIESSFVVEAMLSGAPTVLMNLNDHPWEYRFAEMPGIAVARSETEVRDHLVSAGDTTPPEAIAAWREEFAVAVGAEAADKVAALVREVAA